MTGHKAIVEFQWDDGETFPSVMGRAHKMATFQAAPHKGMVLQFGNYEGVDHCWEMVVHRVEYNVDMDMFKVYCHDLTTDVEGGPGFTRFGFYHVWEQVSEDWHWLTVYYDCHEEIDCSDCAAKPGGIDDTQSIVYELGDLVSNLEKSGWLVGYSLSERTNAIKLQAQVEGRTRTGVVIEAEAIAPGKYMHYSTKEGWSD